MQKSRNVWVTELPAVDIRFGPVLSSGEAFESEHSVKRQMALPVSHQNESEVPQLGEHTTDALRSLNYDMQDIDRVRHSSIT